jgi:hypothetical protein
MNAEVLSIFLVPIYLIVGTAGVALMMGWAMKRFGSPKK